VLKNIKEILDSTYKIRQRIKQPDIPKDVIPLVSELIKHSLDNVCGLQLKWAFERAIDKLCSEGILFTVGAIDFRNLSGLNKYFEIKNPKRGAHEQANAVLREIARDAIKHYTKKSGGEAYRVGGDEFSIILPKMTVKEAVPIMESIRKKTDEIVKKHGLGKEPHPKHDYLPTGAGGIDYGCADSNQFSSKDEIIAGADHHLGISKREFLNNIVSRQPDPKSWIWNENGHYQRIKSI